MLKDVTPLPKFARNPIAALIGEINQQASHLPKKIADGVWQFGHWNPDFEVLEKLTELWRLDMEQPTGDDRLKSYLEKQEEKAARYARDFPGVEYHWLSEYGVCDNWEQITARWPHLVADPEAYFISMVEIRREHQSPDGGWRWHKWGEYIGTQKPEHEYLYDEKHIDVVYTYHIYRLDV